MTRLRRFSKKPARRGFSAALLVILSLALCATLSSCTSSTTPTFLKEDIAQAMKDIAKKEYGLEILTRLVGQTLWVYIPVEDIFIKAEKPEKYTEKFALDYAGNKFNEGSLSLRYLIKPIREQEKLQQLKYNKEVMEKVNNVWKVLRRVIFSMERRKGKEPRFFCMVTADVKNGFEVTETFYLLDLKKVSYGFISWGEYQHRAVQETNISPQIVGDRAGAHLQFTDISMQDFIVKQITHRIRLKFSKPEVEPGADIDKEILKIAVHTIRTYDFRDFSSLELTNLLTRNKIVLDKKMVWEASMEK